MSSEKFRTHNPHNRHRRTLTNASGEKISPAEYEARQKARRAKEDAQERHLGFFDKIQSFEAVITPKS